MSSSDSPADAPAASADSNVRPSASVTACECGELVSLYQLTHYAAREWAKYETPKLGTYAPRELPGVLPRELDKYAVGTLGKYGARVNRRV